MVQCRPQVQKALSMPLDKVDVPCGSIVWWNSKVGYLLCPNKRGSAYEATISSSPGGGESLSC